MSISAVAGASSPNVQPAPSARPVDGDDERTESQATKAKEAQTGNENGNAAGRPPRALDVTV